MTFYTNVNLINKTTAISSFNLTDIQSTSGNSFMSALLIHALDILNIYILSTLNDLTTSAFILYNF